MNITISKSFRLNIRPIFGLILLCFLTQSCRTTDVKSQQRSEKVYETGDYKLCVEVDERDKDDNETLKEPLGDTFTIQTNPINVPKSIYRYRVNKNKFRFFCSPLSEWSFEKVALSRPYPGTNGFEVIQAKLRWAFHHKPDGADLLITSTWFLTEQLNNLESEIKIVNSDIFSEQVHRLRLLEQASFCLQSELIPNSLQEELCSQILSELSRKYFKYKEQVLRDASDMQKYNTEY